jgi:cytochrome c-type biogenesis protein CcmH/NrfF
VTNQIFIFPKQHFNFKQQQQQQQQQQQPLSITMELGLMQTAAHSYPTAQAPESRESRQTSLKHLGEDSSTQNIVCWLVALESASDV